MAKAAAKWGYALFERLEIQPIVNALHAADVTSDALGKQASKLSGAAAALVTHLAGELAPYETQARALASSAPCILPAAHAMTRLLSRTGCAGSGGRQGQEHVPE
jgi:hypothetical protein